MNPEYSSLDGVLFNKDLTTLILCPGAKRGSYTIPDGVTTIGGSAFYGCTSLTDVTIPDGITSLDGGTFYGCASLTCMTMPESIIQIGNQVFWGCTNLGRVYFQGNIPSIYFDVFSGSGEVTVYYLPGTVGWAHSFDNRPTALWIPITPNLDSVTEANQLRLVTHSPAPATVRVQRSANLVDWEDWRTVSRDEGPSELRDPDARTRPYRFYRGIEE